MTTEDLNTLYNRHKFVAVYGEIHQCLAVIVLVRVNSEPMELLMAVYGWWKCRSLCCHVAESATDGVPVLRK